MGVGREENRDEVEVEGIEVGSSQTKNWPWQIKIKRNFVPKQQ